MRNFLLIFLSIGITGCISLSSLSPGDFTLTCKQTSDPSIERNFVYEKKTKTLTEDNGTETIFTEDLFFQINFQSDTFILKDGEIHLSDKMTVVEYMWRENVVVIRDNVLQLGRGWVQDGDPWVGDCKGGL